MDIRSRQPSLDAVTNFIGLEGELAEVKPLHCDRSVGHLALVDHPARGVDCAIDFELVHMVADSGFVTARSYAWPS